MKSTISKLVILLLPVLFVFVCVRFYIKGDASIDFDSFNSWLSSSPDIVDKMRELYSLVIVKFSNENIGDDFQLCFSNISSAWNQIGTSGWNVLQAILNFFNAMGVTFISMFQIIGLFWKFSLNCGMQIISFIGLIFSYLTLPFYFIGWLFTA